MSSGWMDILFLFFVALIGGIVGGALGAVLSRASCVRKRDLFSLPRRPPVKVIPFPKRPT